MLFKRAIALVGLLATSILAQAPGSLLAPAEVEKRLPATVYYAGQTAPTQLRNSGGVKFADGHYVLAALVDTSGYSSGVASKYQGYLITEVALEIGENTLPAGAYGIGFIPGDKFVVTDLGGSDVFTARAATDAALARPRPLQLTADPAGGFRIYSGRAYIQFRR